MKKKPKPKYTTKYKDRIWPKHLELAPDLKEEKKHEKCWSPDGIFWHCSEFPHENCKDCVEFIKIEPKQQDKDYKDLIIKEKEKMIHLIQEQKALIDEQYIAHCKTCTCI